MGSGDLPEPNWKDKHYILSAGKGLDGCATSGRKRGNA